MAPAGVGGLLGSRLDVACHLAVHSAVPLTYKDPLTLIDEAAEMVPVDPSGYREGAEAGFSALWFWR